MPNRQKSARGLVYWDERDEGRLSSSLSRLLGILVIEDGKVVTREGFKLWANNAILAWLVNIPEIDSDQVKRHLVYRAVFRIPLLRRRGVAGFCNALAREVGRHLERPVQKWRIVFPINLDRRSISRKRWFTSQGVRFSIRSWGHLQRKLDLQEWEQEARLLLPEAVDMFGQPFIPLEAEAEGRDYEEAFAKVETAFDLLRAVINWQSGAFAIVKQFGGRPTPPAKVPPPLSFGIFNAEGGYENLYYTMHTPHRYRENYLKRDQLDRIDRLLRQLRPSGSAERTRNLIVRALQMYGRAIDGNDWGETFLGLWQVLELLTRGPREERLRMEQVKDRTSTLLGQQNTLRDLLELVYARRNRLVHMGEFTDDGMRDAQFLKIIVEAAIGSLYGLIRICPTWDSLVIFYKNAPSGDHVLSERIRVLRAVERRRKQDKS